MFGRIKGQEGLFKEPPSFLLFLGCALSSEKAAKRSAKKNLAAARRLCRANMMDGILSQSRLPLARQYAKTPCLHSLPGRVAAACLLGTGGTHENTSPEQVAFVVM